MPKAPFLSLALVLLSFAPPAFAELLRNGDFSAGLRGWELERLQNTPATIVVAKDESGGAFVRVDTPAAAAAPHHVQLVQRRLTLEQGRVYRVTFRARGEPAARITANIKIDRNPWPNLWTQPVNLETGWKTYSHAFTATQSTDIARITLTGLGAGAGRYEFTDLLIVSE